MGLKEKFFGNMMGRMSPEEKSRMMQEMMDKFLENMSTDEKKEMMNNMMPKMMAGMMDGKGFPMMGMMKNMSSMMGGKKDGTEKSDGPTGFNPMEMCKKMMATMEKSNDLATYATPEVRALFEEWAAQIEEEILASIREKDSADPDEIAQHFKLSKNSVNYFLTKLAQKGKIHLKAEHVKEKKTPSDA